MAMSAKQPITDSDKQKKKKLRFRSSLPFSHLPPYEDLFAERVPVLQVFQIACTSYLMAKTKKWIKPSKPFISVECGVFTGSSLIACSNIAVDAGIPFRMIGLDTFTGLPELSETDKSLAPKDAAYLTKKFFDDTSLDAVKESVKQAGLKKYVELHQGLFSQTLPILPERLYNFVNIDCDLYEPHLECLNYFYPRMSKGGIIFFDDYYSRDYPMGRVAIDEFMKDKQEKLIHIRYGNAGKNLAKSYFVKN